MTTLASILSNDGTLLDIVILSLLVAVGSILLFASLFWLFADARLSGFSGFLIVLVAFIFWPFSIIVWLVIRPPRSERESRSRRKSHRSSRRKRHRSSSSSRARTSVEKSDASVSLEPSMAASPFDEQPLQEKAESVAAEPDLEQSSSHQRRRRSSSSHGSRSSHSGRRRSSSNRCRKCGHRISSTVVACPHCGTRRSGE